MPEQKKICNGHSSNEITVSIESSLGDVGVNRARLGDTVLFVGSHKSCVYVTETDGKKEDISKFQIVFKNKDSEDVRKGEQNNQPSGNQTTKASLASKTWEFQPGRVSTLLYNGPDHINACLVYLQHAHFYITKCPEESCDEHGLVFYPDKGKEFTIWKETSKFPSDCTWKIGENYRLRIHGLNGTNFVPFKPRFYHKERLGHWIQTLAELPVACLSVLLCLITVAVCWFLNFGAFSSPVESIKYYIHEIKKSGEVECTLIAVPQKSPPIEWKLDAQTTKQGILVQHTFDPAKKNVVELRYKSSTIKEPLDLSSSLLSRIEKIEYYIRGIEKSGKVECSLIAVPQKSPAIEWTLDAQTKKQGLVVQHAFDPTQKNVVEVHYYGGYIKEPLDFSGYLPRLKKIQHYIEETKPNGEVTCAFIAIADEADIWSKLCQWTIKSEKPAIKNPGKGPYVQAVFNVLQCPQYEITMQYGPSSVTQSVDFSKHTLPIAINLAQDQNPVATLMNIGPAFFPFSFYEFSFYEFPFASQSLPDALQQEAKDLLKKHDFDAAIQAYDRLEHMFLQSPRIELPFIYVYLAYNKNALYLLRELNASRNPAIKAKWDKARGEFHKTYLIFLRGIFGG